MDVELRTLERAALAGGARERLAWARSLERAGRRDEAVAALVPVRDDPDVRAHLDALAAWRRIAADAAGSSFLDARPVAREPVVRWTTEVPVERPCLLASPLAVVATDDHGCLVAMDPATGAPRNLPQHRCFLPTLELGLATLVFQDRNGHERALDVVTGKSRDLANVARARAHTSMRDRDFVVRLLDARAVEAHIAEPQGTLGSRLWRYPPKGELAEILVSGGGVAITPTRVLVRTENELIVLDRATGALVFRGEGDFVVADALGLVGQRRRSVFAYDWSGRLLWSKGQRSSAVPRALAPRRVLVAGGGASLVLERDGGSAIHETAIPGWPLGVVRDVVYLRSPSRLEARTLEGEKLWSLPVAGSIEAFAALDARIFVAVATPTTRRRSVLCLEEPGTRGGG